MFKFLIPLLLSVLLLPSCDRADPIKPAVQPTDTPQMLTHIYRETELPFPKEHHYGGIAGTDSHGNTVLYLTKTEYRQDGDGNTIYYNTIREMTVSGSGETNLSDRIIEPPNGSFQDYVLAGDDRLVLASDFDTETMSTTLTLHRILPDGTTETVENLAALFPETAFNNPQWPQINAMAADGEGNLYIAAPHAVLFLNPDLSVYGILENAQCHDLLTKDGTVYLRCFEEKRGTAVLRAILRDERSLDVPLEAFPPVGETVRSYHFGADYPLYFTTERGLYGQDEFTQTFLMDFDSSNLPDVLDALAILDSEHIFTSFTLGTERITTMLQKAPDVDLADVSTVTLALLTKRDGSMATDVSSLVINYNRTHPETRIQLLDYTDTQNANGVTRIGGGVERLLRDMEAGNVQPDLFYGASEELIVYLVSRGLAADFTPYLTADDTYTLDNLFGGVKNTYTHNGILYGLPQMFTVDYTLLADRRIFADVVDHWTLEMLFAMMDSLGEDVWLDAALESPDWIDSFIDWESGTCHFDDPLFARILDRAMTMTVHMPKAGQAAVRDGETENMYRLYQNGTIPLVTKNYRMLSDFIDEDIYFGEGNALRLGFPSADGKGSTTIATASTSIFMLHADSTDPDTAWAFVRYVMDTSADGFMMAGMRKFPAWKHVYEAVAHMEVGMNYFVTYMGSKNGTSREIALEPDGTYEGEVGMKAVLTREKLEEYARWLDEIGVPFAIRPGVEEVEAIIEEEAAAFVSGDCTAVECAKRVQSRVGIWLAERG